MFSNLINLNDFVVLFEKVSQKGIGRVASRIFHRDEGRIKNAWNNVSQEQTHWWDIPEVMKRWNLKITGNEEIELPEYVRDMYLSNSEPISGISIGCGTGNKEIKWVQSIKNLYLKGIDISNERIRIANESAKKNGVEERAIFEVGDVYSNQLGIENYDLIIFDNSLHHFSPIAVILDKVHQALKANGLLIVNEYVGPSRFQWTTKQLEIVNGLLKELPEDYRRKKPGNALKKKVYRPGRLSMYINDPSEAVESNRIEWEINKLFTTIEKKEYGGAVLQLLFKDIALNFINNKTETKRILNDIFEKEDQLMKENSISSDFKLFIAKKYSNGVFC